MNLFVDTSVWSLAFRRDTSTPVPEVRALIGAIEAGEPLFSTGLVLQELLQGFRGPRDRTEIISRFSALPLLVPDREDHTDAAEIRNKCRRAGIEVGTVDALLAQLCVRHELTMLTSDNDFYRISEHASLRIWGA